MAFIEPMHRNAPNIIYLLAKGVIESGKQSKSYFLNLVSTYNG